ncbi:hypothetical protein AAG906_029294 [Vitis piasezkii]
MAQDEVPHDSLLPPPPPPLDQTVPHALPYLLHSQSKVVPPAAVHTTIPEDTHTCMDPLYDVEDGISRGLWSDSSLVDRSIDVGVVSSTSQRPPKRHQPAIASPISPQFRMDLHCAYHQGPGHETNRCTALRHTIQDLINQGLSDDRIHMLSWDDYELKPMVVDESYESPFILSRDPDETFYRDHVALPFDEHGSIVVLDMMRSMSFLREFVATVDHDTPFGLGFVSIKVAYRYMALLHKEKLIVRLLHMPFDYLVGPYKMSLAYYFLSDGVPSTSTSVLVTLSSPDRTSLLTFYFPKKIDEYGTSGKIAYMIDGVIPCDEYSDEMLMFVPTLGLLTVVAHGDDVFEGIISPVVAESKHVKPPLSFDRLRRLHPRWSFQVKKEIQKQLRAGFLLVVEYPEWLANVVPYNQILDGSEDMEKTSFITEWGTYCYRVMSFGLKNAIATYREQQPPFSMI